MKKVPVGPWWERLPEWWEPTAEVFRAQAPTAGLSADRRPVLRSSSAEDGHEFLEAHQVQHPFWIVGQGR